MKFIDEVQIFAKSGHGGRGAVNFRREKLVPRGGPDGGDGGRGGNVIFVVDAQMGSLLDLRYKKNYIAKDGDPGAGNHKHGKNGEDMLVRVPRGTRVLDHDNHILCDLSDEQQEFVCFQGGRGGKGNSFFKTSVNQAPEQFQPGEDGEEGAIRLELKLLADIGIIGYPNVGKSTLISRISSARPKMADYEFTTLIPNLGVVSIGEFRSIVVADIPGLIPGAHNGAGLGIRFLKHIERTRGFVHLIDVSDYSGREPFQDFEDINYELKMYDEAHSGEEDFLPLMNRTQIIALNKIDAVSPERMELTKRSFEKLGYKVVLISAFCGHGLKELTQEMGNLVIKEQELESAE